MRLLIVSPHFPPSNTPDSQRVRLILPYLSEHGVEAEVLCVKSEQVAAPQDMWLEGNLPANLPVHRVSAMPLGWTWVPGLGTLTYRALGALRQRGDDLLRERQFDLVYFSTTQFGVHALGPEWKARFGVPFVMDYQDLWNSDYYRERPDVVPPGGRLKFSVASWLSRRQEPRVLRHCSGITSVSAAYPEQLARRYGWLSVDRHQESGARGQEAILSAVPQPDNRQQTTDNRQPSSHLPSLVLPFPGDARDFERVRQDGIRQSVFDPNDGLKHWVYVGRGGGDMAVAVRAIFAALAARKAKGGKLKAEMEGLRLHFIGTSYAAAGCGAKTIEPLATEYGLEDIVAEHPDRIPYFEALRCLLDADALIVPGSDDPGYTASKIYPYLLAGKPLLAVFHEASSVVGLIRNVGGGSVIPFASGETAESIAARIAQWLACGEPEQPVPLMQEAFAPCTASSQARQLSGFFTAVLEHESTNISPE